MDEKTLHVSDFSINETRLLFKALLKGGRRAMQSRLVT